MNFNSNTIDLNNYKNKLSHSHYINQIEVIKWHFIIEILPPFFDKNLICYFLDIFYYLFYNKFFTIDIFILVIL